MSNEKLIEDAKKQLEFWDAEAKHLNVPFYEGEQYDSLKQFRIDNRDFAERVIDAMSSPKPSDDELWEQTVTDRDTYHDYADRLADAIGEYFGFDVGEHSNMNCPWVQALENIPEKPKPSVQAVKIRDIEGFLRDVERSPCSNLVSTAMLRSIVLEKQFTAKEDS